MTPTVPPFSLPLPQSVRSNALWEKAADLETAFLAEMLAHTGLGESSESFGGGIGEEQFASFLRHEEAAAMVKAGGIGLTEVLFRALAGAGENDAKE